LFTINGDTTYIIIIIIYFSDEIETLNAYKSEIFDRKENIKKLVLDLPANLLIQKRLIDVEDSNIIDC